MIKAGSLFYAVVISVVMAITSGMCIMTFYLSDIEFQSYDDVKRLNLNVNSGINLLLADGSNDENSELKKIDLYGNETDSVELQLIPWGAFEILISKAIIKKRSSVKVALSGHSIQSAEFYSIYLADEGKPLALSGNTIIRGNAYLPSSGVKRAYIEGANYSGSELIYGQIVNSKKVLPEFDKKLIKSLQQVFTEKTISNNDSVFEVGNELSNDSILNSFLNSPVVYKSKGKISVVAGFYKGNIAIISDKEVIIYSNAILNDVIIYAPKVRFKERFKGSVQIFATDSIIIEKDVILNYPSVIGLIPNNSKVSSSINIAENDTIKGSIFSYQKELSPSAEMRINISKQSFIAGQIQTNGVVDIKGCVYGSLMCRKILLSTSSSTYENHLLNATIDFTKLSKEYVGTSVINSEAPKSIVKWLN